MDELFDDAAARAKRYWQSLSERRVSPASDALARLTELEEPFPADQSDPRAVLALLDETGSPATLATAGPRFFGFVIGGALPAALAANWLAAAWDQNAGLIVGSPIDARLEEIALGWLLDVLELAGGNRRGLRDRRDDGQLHGTGRRPPRRSGARRLGRRGRRPVRRAADHRRRRRGSASDADARRSACSAWGASA